MFIAYSLPLAALYLPQARSATAGAAERHSWRASSASRSRPLAGAAPSGGVLIAARALQGVAAAFMATNSLALLRERYGGDAGRAVGLWTAFTSVATLGGPPLGGVIVEWVSWRWIFFINLPLALATLVLAQRGRCARLEEHRVGRLDIPGAALAAPAFGMVTYGMVDGAARLRRPSWAFAVAAVRSRPSSSWSGG